MDAMARMKAVEERLRADLGQQGGLLRQPLRLDAGAAQAVDAAVRGARVGIERSGDHPRHARRDQRLAARRRGAVVIAGLERDVGSGAADVVAGRGRSVQRLDLGMGRAFGPVEAFAQGARAAHEDGADAGVGRGAAPAAFGQFVGATQVDAVERAERYGVTSTPRQNATRSLMSMAAVFGAG